MTDPGCPPRAGTSPADHLAAARGSRDPAELRRLAATPHPFVWQALAENPRTPADTLALLTHARSDEWNDHRLLRLLAEHPGADGEVLGAVLRAVAASLTAGARPYGAALALAGNPRADPGEVAALGALRGASARLRRGLRERLAVRGSAGPGPR
ncbi:hypothetical protein ABZ249_14395 [Nocardiopsis sp. NPDC006139]|uniref:hypothetical protein n=1 Tax=unclassified Nocardiopsis TaxID=2649073 RepID=UPI0033AE4B66